MSIVLRTGNSRSCRCTGDPLFGERSGCLAGDDDDDDDDTRREEYDRELRIVGSSPNGIKDRALLLV